MVSAEKQQWRLYTQKQIGTQEERAAAAAAAALPQAEFLPNLVLKLSNLSASTTPAEIEAACAGLPLKFVDFVHGETAAHLRFSDSAGARTALARWATSKPSGDRIRG